MHDNRPSTSAEGDDDEECCGNSLRCKLCLKADVQIHSNVKEMDSSQFQKRSLPPDRSTLSQSITSSFLLFLVLCSNISIANGFSTSFTQPYTKVTVREYDDNGIGVARFAPPAHGRLQRMVYDRNTNRLVIGAVNHLYDVPTSLTEFKEDVVIGPEDNCADRNSNCDVFVKALTIDRAEHALVDCSSANGGVCRRRILGNISHVVEESERKIVPYTQESVVTALITETCGINTACNRPDMKTLVLGATPIERGDNFNLVAGYNMARGKKFSLFSGDFESLTLPFNTREKMFDNKIDYIAAFEYNNFVYLVMRQGFDINNGTSKLARFCKSDTKFHSYSEIPLECKTNYGEKLLYVQDAYISNPQYTLASEFKESSIDHEYFFAVFSTAYRIHDSDNPTSGLCVFKMKDIEDKFTKAQKDCNDGNGTKGFIYHPSYTPSRCVATALPKVECGNEVNPFVNGHNYPVTAESFIHSQNEFFTSVFIHGVQDVNVAFIGTSKGKLHKAVITNSKDAKIFKTLDLESSPILQDKVFVAESSNLFVMTERAVYKIKVDHCESVDSCNDCLRQENPFCGWCLMTNKCLKLKECHQSIGIRHFISYKHKNNCPSISEIVPKQQYIATSTILKIKARNIQPNNSLKCVFEIGSRSHVREITGTEEALQCPTPTFSNLQDAGIVDPEASSVIAKLSITTNKRTLVSTNITFFDCQQHKSCYECANSTFSCTWCIGASKCVANPEDTCLRDKLVVSKMIQQPATLKGPDSCPLFDAHNHNNFYIGAGRVRQIAVTASNLDSSMQVFKCNFSYGSHHLKTVSAKLVRNQIQCHDFKFDHFDHIQKTTGGDSSLPIDLSILWAPNEKATSGRVEQDLSRFNKLDNPHNIQVIVYLCEKLASNCGNCLTLPRHYECGWCEESRKCTFRSSCNHWTSIMTANARCKGPQILDFWPKKGPVNGHTQLNITGINLGLSQENLVVTVGLHKCEILEYKKTESIVCNTQSPGKPLAGDIIVMDKGGEPLDEYTATAGDFNFVDPEILRFAPSKGPVSGGTDITIIGSHMDSGRDVQVMIGAVNCQVRERSEKYLICRTNRASAPGYNGTIVMNVDGSSFSRKNSISFEFRENPIVTRVKHAVSIADGGIFVDVIGRDFDLLQRPRMVAEYEDQKYYSTEICKKINNTNMICKTPAIPVKQHTHFSIDQPLYLHFGFSFDGEEESYKGYTTSDEETKLKIYPNPQISSIGNFQTDQAGSDLVVKGANLNLAASVRDVNVTVGGAPCIVTALASVTLTCQLKQEIEDLFASSDQLDVVVKIGNHLVDVGTVTTNSGFGSPSYMIPIIVIAAICLLLLLVLMVLYKRKNNSHNRQLRTLKHQMTSIEMKVAQECKEAFHELQTNLNAIAGSLPDGTSFIPFLSYQDYTARILFPHSFNNHPVLRELEVDQERAHQVESGLRQLHHLVHNRTFLLSFVRTIDENKYLLQKDRVYVGSLLMVILQERMDYCTEILKQLLKDLIKRNLEARFQPKILFRRAESVAERMLSVWFSFLMYRYLTGPAGEQLYQFYWATKQQTEKGPQDAITLEARYSLSEEKLLRSTVQCKELTVFVISEGSGVISDTQVTVLDCDSITQVKEKCIDAKYRTIPYSGRPTACDVDLELRLQSGVRKLLLDLDQSSKHENGHWKQNTLAHYGIDNKAMLALIPKQANSSYNLSLLSDRSDKSSSSFHNSPTLTRPFGTNSSNGHSKDTMRVFHLVRQQGEQDPQEKMMSEIYLTRLLHMKGILQRFIENLFEVIFSTSNRSVRLPACVKYMFDFLDDQAREHGIVDEDVVHAWKSNALPLRFWVNLIKNPDFIFDISKPTKIEGSLNVVAQTLMDACSTQELHLTKDSPSSKLLFANDIDKYKTLVHNYYDDIAKLVRIPEADMSSFLLQESQSHQKNFTVYSSALNELYVYITQNRDMIFEELSKNEYALHEALPERFQKMLDTMDIMPDNTLINNGSLDNYNSKSRLMSSSNSRFY